MLIKQGAIPLNKKKTQTDISSVEEITPPEEGKIVFPKGWLIFSIILLVLIVGLSIAVFFLPSA